MGLEVRRQEGREGETGKDRAGTAVDPEEGRADRLVTLICVYLAC